MIFEIYTPIFIPFFTIDLSLIVIDHALAQAVNSLL